MRHDKGHNLDSNSPSCLGRCRDPPMLALQVGHMTTQMIVECPGGGIGKCSLGVSFTQHLSVTLLTCCYSLDLSYTLSCMIISCREFVNYISGKHLSHCYWWLLFLICSFCVSLLLVLCSSSVALSCLLSLSLSLYFLLLLNFTDLVSLFHACHQMPYRPCNNDSVPPLALELGPDINHCCIHARQLW